MFFCSVAFDQICRRAVDRELDGRRCNIQQIQLFILLFRDQITKPYRTSNAFLIGEPVCKRFGRFSTTCQN